MDEIDNSSGDGGDDNSGTDVAVIAGAAAAGAVGLLLLCLFLAGCIVGLVVRRKRRTGVMTIPHLRDSQEDLRGYRTKGITNALYLG